MKLVSKIGVYLGVFLLVLTLANPGFAQETTGTIQGTVKDATGAVVPKAAVEISGPSLITPRTMDTDEAGFYRFTLLPTGVYAVTVTTTGFRQAKRTTIKLEVGRTLPIDFGLEVGAVAATVEVQATPEIVDTTSSKAGVNISDVVINNIPKGRSFTSMIVLAPGARPEPLQAGFQIDGASEGENVYFKNNVRVVRAPYDDKSELVVQTSYLHIIPDDNIAKTDQPVTITDANIVVDAIGLELNNETRILKLHSRVRGTYEQKKK